MKVRGLVTDGGATLAGATVNLTFLGQTYFTASNSTGLFEFNFNPPDAEGDYVASVCSSLPPYSVYCGLASFEVARRKSLSLSLADSVKVNWGGSYVVNLTIFNRGEAEISGLKVYASGLPDGYLAQSSFDLGSLPVSGSASVSIPLSIPSGSGGTVLSLRVNASAFGVYAERIAAITISELIVINASQNQDQANAQDQNSQLTGSILGAVPQLGWDVMYLAVFTIVSLKAALVARKRFRPDNAERREVKDTLMEIKKEIYADENTQPGRARQAKSADKKKPSNERAGKKRRLR